MQKLKSTILLMCLFMASQILRAQCSLSANSGGFDYDVNIVDLSIDNVIYTQSGSTCNVNIVVGYDISIITNGVQPSWWNPQDMDVMQGNFNCVGGSGASFFNLPNIGGQGTATSATFSYANTQCSNVVLDCPITLQIGGPGGLSYNGPCGNLITVVLPITLSDFSYEETANKQLTVKWQTQQEETMNHFILERSTNLNDWEQVVTTKAHNLNQTVNYYEDVKRLDQKHYLRLKMIDNENQEQYSKVLTVEETLTSDLAVSPNPVANELVLHGFDAGSVVLMNSVGQSFKVQEIASNKIDVSSLPAGLYFVRSTKSTSANAVQFLKK